MNKKTWEILEAAPSSYLEKFKSYDPVVAQLLFSRGIKTLKEAQSFFEPDYLSLSDPFEIKDMDKAVKRIITAIDKKERIVIFGDYDVDGITSTALLYRLFENIGVDINFYIPHRMKEGYGMSSSAIDILAEKGVDLIVTVDNGISSHKEVAHANSKGIDVVITDHHEVTKDIPKACAIINPKQKGDKSGREDLCGVGLAFKLATALVRELNRKKKKEIVSEGRLKWLLDLVALGSIADMVPLVGENRTLVYYGLVVLTKTKNIGLQAIAKVGGVDLGQSSPYTVGFQIGPRLNAAGRMAHAATALELLLTSDVGEAEMLALRLERLNRERQNIVSTNIDNVKASLVDKKLDSILVLKDSEWTAGVVGLIAGRMAEEFSRPVFCMTDEGDILRGSIRSSINFSVIDALVATKEVYLNYGGHRNAGGFSILKENFDIFYEKIVEYGNGIIKEEDMVGVLVAEAEILLENISSSLYEKIKSFEPFGEGNKEPVFITRGVKIKDVKKVGNNGGHLKLVLSCDKTTINAIAFNFGDMSTELYYGREVDIAYNLVENNWGNRKNIELKIKDIKTI